MRCFSFIHEVIDDEYEGKLQCRPILGRYDPRALVAFHDLTSFVTRCLGKGPERRGNNVQNQEVHKAEEGLRRLRREEGRGGECK